MRERMKETKENDICETMEIMQLEAYIELKTEAENRDIGLMLEKKSELIVREKLCI